MERAAERPPFLLPNHKLFGTVATGPARQQKAMSRTLSRLGACLILLFALPAFAATVTVTNTNDSGPGSLRQAILDVNAGSADKIAFAIGSGHQVIQPLSMYPDFTKPATIDGRTQPGYGGSPLIEI